MTNNPYDEWQDKEAAENGRKPKRAFFCSPRTGKTLAAVKSMDVADVRRPLVTAPLSVCRDWEKTLARFGYDVVPLYGMPRPQMLREMRAPHGSKVAFIVGWRRLAAQTPDERKQRRRSAITEGLLRLGNDGLVLDESHEMSRPGAAQSRIARQLAWASPWVRELTGTPASKHYGNLFCPMMALDPRPIWEGGFGKSYEALAQRYLIRDTTYPSRVLGHTPEIEEFHARMMPLVTIKRREDLFGPDQWVESEVRVELPASARKVYDKLAKEWLIEDESMQLTADHILTRIMRLHQIASGYVTDDLGVDRLLHTAKLDELTHQLTNVIESGEKAIVFYNFRWEGEQIAERARAIGVPVYRIYGNTSTSERAACVDLMGREAPAIAVVQTQSGGVGISFAEVAYQFVMSEGLSFIRAEQAHDRTFKPSTQRFVTHIRCADSVDETIAALLASNESIHNTLRMADRESLAFGRIKRPPLLGRKKLIAL